MQSSLIPIIISQRIFGCQNFFKPRGGVIRNVWFIVLTLLFSFVCLKRSVSRLVIMETSIKNDNYEGATMGSIPLIRYFCLFLSIFPMFNIKIFNVKRSVQTFNILYGHVYKIKSSTKLIKELNWFVKKSLFGFWITFMAFFVREITFWSNLNDTAGEREMILIFRGIHSLIEEEIIIQVWIQAKIFHYINAEILTVKCSSFRLEKLRIQHAELSSQADEICKIYEAHLLYSWTIAFLDILESAYYILVASFHLSKSVDSSVVFDCLVWIIALYLRIIHLTVICSGTIEEAKSTASALQKLEHTIHDKKNMREEIHMFHRQLLHTPVKFSIYGSIPLDSSFISMITAAVISYMLVLIQFHTIQHAEPCPQTNSTA